MAIHGWFCGVSTVFLGSRVVATAAAPLAAPVAAPAAPPAAAAVAVTAVQVVRPLAPLAPRAVEPKGQGLTLVHARHVPAQSEQLQERS